MNDVYEQYHDIIARLVAGEPAGPVAGKHGAADERRDAFIRVMKEELLLLGKASHC